MSHPDIPSFYNKKLYNEEYQSGMAVNLSLQALFKQIGFNPQLISTYGAMCLDFEYGPEIVALKPLNPKIIVVSDPKHNIVRLGDHKDEHKQWYIEKFSEG